MAKIITSKSGKTYVQLDNSELSASEQTALGMVLDARKAEREAMDALRSAVLNRAEFKDRGLTVYVDWGKVKVTKAAEDRPIRQAKPTMTLAEAMAAAELDGLSH